MKTSTFSANYYLKEPFSWIYQEKGTIPLLPQDCLCSTVAANNKLTFCTKSLKGAIAMKNQNSRCYPIQVLVSIN